MDLGTRRQKHYSKEFKLEAIKLAEELGSASKAAESLGVGNSSLCKWIASYKNDGDSSFPGKGNLKPEDDEVRRLRLKVKRLEMEKSILKKAITFFGDQP